ncbi:MAG: phosphatase PAP2 family protein [Thermoflexales bacterium]
MTENGEAVPAQAVEAATQQVNAWRRGIDLAGAIVSKPWRRYRSRVFMGYMVVALAVFTILAVLAKTVAFFTFDVTITQAIQTLNFPGFGPLMAGLTWIGFGPQAYVISALALVFLLVSGLRWEALVSFVSLILSSVVGLGIKALIDRPRPSADVVNVFNQLKDYSFPSGHVLYFTTFFGFLLFLAFTLLRPTWWRKVTLIVLSGMVALIGLSRIYVGQHWASDVIAAYLLGSAWLGASILIYRWGKPRFFVNRPVAKETPASAP